MRVHWNDGYLALKAARMRSWGIWLQLRTGGGLRLGACWVVPMVWRQINLEMGVSSGENSWVDLLMSS